MIILTDRHNLHDSIIEERDLWISNVLSSLGIVNATPEDLLSKDIEIWIDASGAADIYMKNELIAYWNEPHSILKYENDKYYFEVTIDCKSIFEDDEIL